MTTGFSRCSVSFYLSWGYGGCRWITRYIPCICPEEESGFLHLSWSFLYQLVGKWQFVVTPHQKHMRIEYFSEGCWSYFSFGSNSMQANTLLVKLYHLKQGVLTWLWNSVLCVDKLGSRQFRLLSKASQCAPPFVGIKKNSKPRSDPLVLLQGPSVCREPRTKYFGIFAGNQER